MILGFTGNRKVEDITMSMVSIGLFMRNLGVKKVLEGHAYGADLLAANAAYLEDIPYEAVIPWKGHRKSIPSDWLPLYDLCFDNADVVTYTNESDTFPGNHAYFKRNRYIIDNSDAVLAFWDGIEKGGTYSTWSKALRLGKTVYLMDSKSYAVRSII